jgi:solute carrier family 13 (sodium-dependent dicarboxylate transporter), member 2/3/5
MSMSDSRLDALKIYKKTPLSWLFNTSTFLGNVVVSLIITYFFRELNYGDAVNYVFLISIISIGLWLTEAIPPFAVGIFIISMMLIGFGTDYIIQDSAQIEMYLGTWTSNVIWLLLGGFFLAEGMKQVELDRYLFLMVTKRFGDSPMQLLGGLFFVTAIASMVMSNTATTAMMISSVLPLVHKIGKDSDYSKALLTGIPAAATIGGIGTVIGSTPNAIAVGALQEMGIYITFVDWLIIGLPTCFVLLFLYYKYLNKKLNISDTEVDITSMPASNIPVNKTKQRVVIFTLFATISLWLTEPIHQIPVAAISVVPILLLTLTQVVGSEQVRALPWDTLMLVAGGLALGIAIVDVGLAAIVMHQITSLPVSIVVVSIFFSIIAVLLSNVMSNTAAASILVPLAVSLPAPFNISAPITVAISCSCALFLPVSTPSNAIAYSTGLVEQKEFRRSGLFFLLLGPTLAFSIVMLWAWLNS